jgi:hypothetical protein
MTDPFEEFEFKPLTEGLGFHKKNKKESTSSMPMNSMGLDIAEESPLRSPLPRQPKAPTPQPMNDSSAAVDEILQTLRSKQVAEQKTPAAQMTKPAPAMAAPKYKPSVSNFSAMFLDFMLVLAASLLCMIVLFSITKADISSTLFGENVDPMILISTVTLFAVVTFIYLVVHRVFLGATPGEWAYDQRLGQPEEMGTIMYAVGTVVRSLIVILTGFFPIPVLSMIMKTDIAGKLSGLKIYERQ